MEHNNPFDELEYLAAGGAGARVPGSVLDHPGGPLNVPPPPQSTSSGSSYHSAASDVLPPPPQVRTQYVPQPWPQPAPRVINVQLPPFWVDRPLSWFATVEARFRLNNIMDEQVRFDLLVNALPETAASLAVDVIEQPPAAYPYTALKHRLLSAHELTDYQKIARLLKMPPLGGRKPSELLAAMLDLCPRGHETSIFFTHLFLERLPAELRIMLGEDDHQDPRPLAAKADQLWALHGGKFATIAAVDEDPVAASPVAAVSSRQPSSNSSRGKKGKSGCGRQSAAAGAAGAPKAAVTPSYSPKELSKMQAELCFYHWTFGDKAQKCDPPCNWGN